MESGSLSSLDNLTHLGLRGGVDMRPTLLRVLTDLYVQKLTHTPDEERHYTELALRLLDAVDVATRAAVAGRLARHLSPPARVIQRLAGDLPDVAERACARIRLLAAQSRHAEATACRRRIGPPRTSKLRDSQLSEIGEPHEQETAAGVVAPIDSRCRERTQRTLLRRQRRRAASHSAQSRNRRPAAGRTRPSSRATPTAPASGWKPRRSPAIARDFAQHLAHSLQIPRAQARRIAGDELGEPIVIAAKALTMPRDVVYRILLFVNTTVGHSVERVHALADALRRDCRRQAAEHMVAIWQALATGTSRRPRTSAAGMERRSPHSRCSDRDVRRAPPRTTGPAATLAGASPKRRDRFRSLATISRKFRPAGFSTSTIQTSGSNFISRAR